jgi:putative glutamine amidotransferase
MARTAKTWRKRALWTALVGLGLVVVGYAGLKIWQWVVVPRNAPRIGASLDTAWHARAGITTTSYEIGLTRAGARVLEFRRGDQDPEAILDEIDGLLLAGGGDIDPEIYGGASEDAQLVDRQRDDFELALIRGALKRGMPILGICRGIQILNVSQGGTIRNLREEPALLEVHGVELDSMDAHLVDIVPGSKLAELLGPGRHPANSFHGQAVGKVGPGLRVAAQSPDGVVEGIELPDRPFVVGMQWHPEMPPQKMAVFEAFVEEAKAYRRRRHGR